MISTLIKEYIELYPAEVASLLESIPEEDAVHFLKKISSEKRCKIVLYLSKKLITCIPFLINNTFLEAFCDTHSSEQVFELYQLLNQPDQAKMIELLPEKIVLQLKYLEKMDSNCIIHWMSDDYISLFYESSVEKAINIITKMKNHHWMLYIHDNNKRLVGEVYFKDIYSSETNRTLSSIAYPVGATLHPDVNIQQVKRHQAWRFKSQLPVVNLEGRQLGIVTIQAILQEIFNEEADFARNIYSGVEQISGVLYSVLNQLATYYRKGK